MKTVARAALALCLFSVLALARNGTYTYSHKATLSTSAAVETIQLPANSGRTVAFESVAIYCSVALELTVERDGTAATTTAGTITAVNASDAASAAQAFSASNVGAGTVLTTQECSAGGTLVLDLRDVGLLSGHNLSIRTASGSGTVVTTFKWAE